MILCTGSLLWWYRLSSFQVGGTKLERFFSKNQHSQRKSLNFENCCNGEVSKNTKIWLSKSIFHVKNYQNLSQFFFSLKNMGFRNEPTFRYENFFPRANFKGFSNPRDEEISITETHGPFENYIPLGVNQAIFLCHVLVFSKRKFLKISARIKKSSNCSSFNFLPMWKSDFFSLGQRRFHEFFENEIYQWPSLILTHAEIPI